VVAGATAALVVAAVVELVDILLALVLVLVVDVKAFGALLVVAGAATEELVVAFGVELVGVGVIDAAPCAKAQFEQW